MITGSSGEALSGAQVEFNRVMKRLESERAKLQRRQAHLDNLLAIANRDLLPMVEELNRTNRDMVFAVAEALWEVKLSKKRRGLLKDLVCGMAEELLGDPCGLSDEDLAKLETILDENQPPKTKQRLGEEAAEAFDYMCGMMEDVARGAGVELDLSDLHPTMDLDDLERELADRLRAATEASEASEPAGTSQRPPSKQTKAQVEKARKLAEQEEVRKRDLKSLYKQLAKALHPDLEPDPQLREHKETWMKRLTGAYSGGDLRELLQIEMEWLGEEASNLASAGDAKLRVYCAVLKEQIAEIKQQATWLTSQPQYAPLRRFSELIFLATPAPGKTRSRLAKDIERHREMLCAIQNSAQRRQLLEQWADHHERAMRSSACPF